VKKTDHEVDSGYGENTHAIPNNRLPEVNLSSAENCGL
jgi:hypothetical protein